MSTTEPAIAELEIVYLDPSELKVDEGNPRTLKPEAAGKLKRGMEHFGLVEPLVLNRRTGTLISGHQRRALALELGLSSVPVALVDLDDDEAKALGLLLNNLNAQGEWDLELLAVRLDELDAVDLLELSAFEEKDLVPAKAEVSFQAKGHGWEELEHRVKCPHPKGTDCHICDALRLTLTHLAKDG